MAAPFAQLGANTPIFWISAAENRCPTDACRKLIACSPGVVRARYTLAFLLVGTGDAAAAAEELREYVAGARRSGAERFAVPRLRMLADTTADPRILHAIAEGLTELGYGAGKRVILLRIAQGAASPERLREQCTRNLDSLLLDPRAALEKLSPAAARGQAS